MKFILSLDGGGMRGCASAYVLEALESRLGKKSCEVFDFIAGTSIGGIMACMLANGHAAKDILPFFSESGPKIFKPGVFWNRSGLFHARYDGKALDEALTSALGNNTMESVLTKLLVPSFDLSSGTPVVFKSTDPQFKSIELRQVGRATSAAQSYFPAYSLLHWMLWDGGNAANNPATCALVEVHAQWPDEEIVLLSIGCGAQPEAFDARNAPGWGLLKVGATTLTVAMETGAEIADYQCRVLLGDKYIRINPVIQNVALDDASPGALIRLQSAGQHAILENSDRLNRIISLLLTK